MRELSPGVRSNGGIATIVGVLMLTSTTTQAFAPTPVKSPLSRMGRTAIAPQQQQIARSMVMDNYDPLDLTTSTSTSPIKSAERKSTDPKPVLQSFLEDNGIDFGKNTPMKAAAAAALMAVALAVLPFDADAAMSGGRMGGSYSSRPMTTRSMPRSSSYSRGGGGYSSGYSYSRRSTTIVSPTVVTPGYGFGYNPFFPGVYGGGTPGTIQIPERAQLHA